jgi:protein-disulfide isomerase
MKLSLLRTSLVAIFAPLLLFALPSSLSAASFCADCAKDGSAATWVSQTQAGNTDGYFATAPCAVVDFAAKFQNTGTTTWLKNGSSQVAFNIYKDPSVYSAPANFLYMPGIQESYFFHPTWIKPYRVGALEESSVAPGQIGTVKMKFQIPCDIPRGAFREDISMATGSSWMSNPRNGDPLGVAHIWVGFSVSSDAYDQTPERRVLSLVDADHVRGDRDALVKIIEFSDFDCPYCKQFHGTMQQVLKNYSPTQVAWVLRHYPLKELHPNAVNAALASECVSEQKGDEGFWKFADLLAGYPTGQGTTDAKLNSLARSLGVNTPQFATCLANKDYLTTVEVDLADGVESGVEGTPHSIVVGSSGKFYVIPGSRSYAEVKSVLDAALAESL